MLYYRTADPLLSFDTLPNEEDSRKAILKECSLKLNGVNIMEDKLKKLCDMLVDYSLEKAKDLGYTCVFICGNGEFYGKSGFVPATTKGIRYADDPEGEALYFLCKELKENFFKDVYGIYHDPKGYFIPHEKPEAFEKYESTFPKKEKLKLPGHIFG